RGGLTEAGEGERGREDWLGHVQRFLGVYRRYAAGVLVETAAGAREAVTTLAQAERQAAQVAAEHARLQGELVARQAEQKELADQLTELANSAAGIRDREIFKTADDLVQRDRAVTALARAADAALEAADRRRRVHGRAVADADERLAAGQEAGGRPAEEHAARRGAPLAARPRRSGHG